MNNNLNLFQNRKFLKPYIIAEIGVNHECDLGLAKLMIEQAADSGASCAKFQAYKASTLASKNSPYYWDLNEESTTSQFDLFSKYDHFSIKEFSILSEFCKEKNIDFMLTAFDEDIADSVDHLVEVHKVASADITNLQLLKKIGSFKKPVIFSCGASKMTEIKNARNILLDSGAIEAIPLHCVLNYPTQVTNAQISFMVRLKEEFGEDIGYSDHTIPNQFHDAQLLSVILGAKVIEKHFTYDKTKKGNDHYHAYDVNDMKSFTERLIEMRKLFGDSSESEDNIFNQEKAIKNARRSLYYKKDLKSGEKIKDSDLIAKRPGHGLNPMQLSEITGKILVKNVKEDSLVSYEDF
tara:strand:+ start:363 stop:1415 length:1053 start_codon:yes stop_codon:yes gene_type:complete